MTISLVDDHILVTEALKSSLLRMPEVDSVQTYGGAEAFLEDKHLPLPDVLIMDLIMNGISGMDLLTICRANFNKEMKIIILSSLTDVQIIKQAIRQGANGFISKSTPLDELKDSVLQVYAGKQYIGKTVREKLLNSVFTEEQVVFHLSPREKEVLNKVCSGLTIKEIAYDLKLSAHTVQYYHRNVMEKFKVKRTTDLIVYAMQNGLYVPDKKNT
jgi:two-component system, NarL family, invasion response regulator UvrY